MVLLPYKIEKAAGLYFPSNTIATGWQMAAQPTALAGPYPWRTAAVAACSSTWTCSGFVTELLLAEIEADIQDTRRRLERVGIRKSKSQAGVLVAKVVVRTGGTAPFDQGSRDVYRVVLVGVA